MWNCIFFFASVSCFRFGWGILFNCGWPIVSFTSSSRCTWQNRSVTPPNPSLCHSIIISYNLTNNSYRNFLRYFVLTVLYFFYIVNSISQQQSPTKSLDFFLSTPFSNSRETEASNTPFFQCDRWVFQKCPLPPSQGISIYLFFYKSFFFIPKR